jgi:hypothetical protein
VTIGPGDTFILTRATGSTPHLWVVLWGPAGAADAYLIVSLSTLRGYSDRTVVIRPGEHPFVQHDTCAVYADARRTTAEKLQQALRVREAISREPVDPALLDRLRGGLLHSPYTPDAILSMAVEEFGASETR